eukprot:symbB.v1.2.030357.t1/scaffold3407.1/size57423/2
MFRPSPFPEASRGSWWRWNWLPPGPGGMERFTGVIPATLARGLPSRHATYEEERDNAGQRRSGYLLSMLSQDPDLRPAWR